MLPPKPFNRWFVLKINGRISGLKHWDYQEAVWRANRLRASGSQVEILNSEGIVVEPQTG